MNDATIVALIILVGVFILIGITIVSAGVEAAIKLWGIMGALTGVAFGAITSYYFTNKSNQHEIRQAQDQKQAAVLALNKAASKAGEINGFVTSLTSALKERIVKVHDKAARDISSDNKKSSLPTLEIGDVELLEKAEQASAQLKDIQALKDTIQ